MFRIFGLLSRFRLLKFVGTTAISNTILTSSWFYLILILGFLIVLLALVFVFLENFGLLGLSIKRRFECLGGGDVIRRRQIASGRLTVLILARYVDSFLLLLLLLL